MVGKKNETNGKDSCYIASILCHLPLSVCHHFSFSFLSATSPSFWFHRPVQPSLLPLSASPPSPTMSATSTSPPCSSVAPSSGKRWYEILLPSVPMKPTVPSVWARPSSAAMVNRKRGALWAASRRDWAARRAVWRSVPGRGVA